jgi:hypothetical protein
VRPSPPLLHHAKRCGDTPTLLSTRGQDVAATAATPRVALVSGTLELLPRDYAGSNHDARPAAAPSPSLSTPRGHSCYCCATPRTATTSPTLLSARGRNAVTPATAPRTDHCRWLLRARSKPLRSTTTPLPSKPLLFGHRARHDAATGTRFARTAINSTALCAIPQHV